MLQTPAVVDAWYLLARSKEIRSRPVSAMLRGVPLVLFRSAGGQAAALVDSCPHRGVPLSLGRVRGDVIECRYHGWQFDGSGQCRRVPARSGAGLSVALTADARAVVEQQGFLWVSGGVDRPSSPPPRFPHLENDGYAHTVHESVMPADLLSVAENILDVPHTSFVHGGIFRGAPRKPVRVEVSRDEHTAEANFIDEATPGGILGRLLALRAPKVRHVDRFRMPCIAEVEYALGESNHLVITSALTPLSDRRTKVTSVASLRLRFASRFLAWIAAPLARRVLDQDITILKAMQENRDRWPGPRNVSTEADLLGPHIARLLKDAEQGRSTSASKRTVQIRT